MKVISKSLKETENFAKKFLQSLKTNNKRTVVVGLYGNLGSGKTTFVQFIAKELGIKENITSPTFVIEKIYPVKFRQGQTRFNGASIIGDHNWPKKLIHIDAYRLQKDEELKSLGFEEILDNSGNLVLIEWPENVSDVLPKNILKLEFEFVDENTRSIKS